jgi:hypothetical protein
MTRRHEKPRQKTAASGVCALLLSLAAIIAVPALAYADGAPAPPTPPSLTQLSPELEREAESIAGSIMSPFCAGRTVSACPNAGPWREDIRRWVSEGVDANEIKRRLAERAPDHNLMGVPPNRLGWALPVGLGIGALGILIFLLRYLVGPRASEPAAAAAAPKAAGASAVAASAATGNAKANASPAAARSNGEDYDARLDEELETLER